MELITVVVGMLENNCYIVSSEQKNAAVFDPGSQPDKILSAISEHNLNIKYIILTHGHYDHIGAVEDIKEKYPNAEVCIGEYDTELLRSDEKSLANFIRASKKKGSLSWDIELEDNDVLTLDELELKIIHTPGHTKGGICIICGDLLFTGDTLFKGECGRTDLYGGDYLTIKKSLNRLAALEGDYKVLPGHGEFSTLQHERRTNKYIGKNDYDDYF